MYNAHFENEQTNEQVKQHVLHHKIDEESELCK